MFLSNGELDEPEKHTLVLLDAIYRKPTVRGAPRIVVGANGMHYTNDEGSKVLDGTSGLWCCNAGHNRLQIVTAMGAARRRYPQYRLDWGRSNSNPVSPQGRPPGPMTYFRDYAQGELIRATGDIIVLSPPLIVERGQIDQIVAVTRAALERID